MQYSTKQSSIRFLSHIILKKISHNNNDSCVEEECKGNII